MTALGVAGPVDEQEWDFRLYIAGQSPKSLRAVTNLRQLCEEHLPGRAVVEIIDLIKNPERARGDSILAIPTLVRRTPPPGGRFIGDLSDTARVVAGLQLEMWPA